MSNKTYSWTVLGVLLLIVIVVGAYLWIYRPSAYPMPGNMPGNTGGGSAGGSSGGQAGGDPIAVSLSLVAQNLTSPLAVKSPGDNSGRLFIVDQVGQIRIVDKSGNLLPTPFLDLKSKIVPLTPSYDERGLLGLAFHPKFKTNGKFYVYYSLPLRAGAPKGWNCTNRLSEFKVSAKNSNLADPKSERVILQIDKPEMNHNGGQIAFGPDGFLYLPTGDGGNANDVGLGHVAGGNAQDLNQLLGKVLRLNIDSGKTYAIPADNPFVRGGGKKEIYAYGFRNPYHISFDLGGSHALIGADAGQNLWEEVDLITKGGNYGWNIKEGRHCFDPNNNNVSPTTCGTRGKTLIDPVIEYKNIRQPGGIGAVVVGGYVYRGSALPALKGKYVFGDWSKSFSAGDGTVMAADMADNNWPFQELQISGRANSRLGQFLLGFGQDQAGEMYVLATDNAGPSGSTGKVYKIIPAPIPVPVTASISISNFSFNPQSITVAAGTKITWTNNDSVVHTVTSDNNFDSGALQPGASYNLTLTAPGTYSYHCSIHTYMTGTVIVQ